MSTTPEELEARVEQLDQHVTLLRHELDGVKTGNAVLQERYAALMSRIDEVSNRVAAPDA